MLLLLQVNNTHHKPSITQDRSQDGTALSPTGHRPGKGFKGHGLSAQWRCLWVTLGPTPSQVRELEQVYCCLVVFSVKSGGVRIRVSLCSEW